jgi:hypothetical protein
VRRVVLQEVTNVLEEHIVSIFRIAENHNLNSQRRENLKPHVSYVFFSDDYRTGGAFMFRVSPANILKNEK